MLIKPLRTSDGFDGIHPFPRDVSTGHFEVFWHNQEVIDDNFDSGWYWWTCEPGCLPDGEAFGPYNTSRQAWCDARRKD